MTKDTDKKGFEEKDVSAKDRASSTADAITAKFSDSLAPLEKILMEFLARIPLISYRKALKK